MTIVQLPPPPVRPAAREKAPAHLVDALLDPAARRRLADAVLARSREFALRGDRVDLWLSIVEQLRERGRREGADRELLAAGLHRLADEVGRLNRERSEIIGAVAAIPFDVGDVEPVEPCSVVRFPGDSMDEWPTYSDPKLGFEPPKVPGRKR